MRSNIPFVPDRVAVLSRLLLLSQSRLLLLSVSQSRLLLLSQSRLQSQ
jgi:hypothetical protein